jgi:hypothetical protein
VSQPLPPPVPDWAASTPDWPGAQAWRPPSTWAPPTAAAAPVPAAAPVRSKAPLALGLVALAGVAAGAVGGAFLVTAVFVGAAQDIGLGIGEGMVSGTEDMYSTMEEDAGWFAGPPLDPADISDPVPPVPGPDATLNAYVQRCFDGDYQSCDDLYFESPPLSDYEQYAGTCGGRVKLDSVMACTELE